MSQVTQRPVIDYTPVSTMSLRDLRAEMVQRAVCMAAQGRTCRVRGDLARARHLESKAAEIMRVARSVNVK